MSWEPINLATKKNQLARLVSHAILIDSPHLLYCIYIYATTYTADMAKPLLVLDYLTVFFFFGIIFWVGLFLIFKARKNKKQGTAPIGPCVSHLPPPQSILGKILYMNLLHWVQQGKPPIFFVRRNINWHFQMCYFFGPKPQLMVNCWFGLVVWDSRDTRKRQSLSFSGIPGIQTTGTQTTHQPLVENLGLMKHLFPFKKIEA